MDDHQRHARLDQTGQCGPLGVADGIVAEIGPLPVEQLPAGEVVEAGDQDGAANAWALQAVEFAVRQVGGHVRRAGRMPHQDDAGRITAVVGDALAHPAHRGSHIVGAGRPGRSGTSR